MRTDGMHLRALEVREESILSHPEKTRLTCVGQRAACEGARRLDPTQLASTAYGILPPPSQQERRTGVLGTCCKRGGQVRRWRRVVARRLPARRAGRLRSRRLTAATVGVRRPFGEIVGLQSVVGRTVRGDAKVGEAPDAAPLVDLMLVVFHERVAVRGVAGVDCLCRAASVSRLVSPPERERRHLHGCTRRSTRRRRRR